MRLFVLLLLPLTFFTSCGDDNVSAGATVEGQWELTRALRNNNETAMLDGLELQFQPDGVLKTNMMGNEQPGTYVWSGEEIVTEGVKVPLTYKITEMTDTTLLLRSSYRGFQFDFELAKVR